MSDKQDSSPPEESGPEPVPQGPFTFAMDRVWWAAASLMIAPVLLAWVVRAAAFATDCQPGPTACFDTLFDNGLGPALKDFLDLSWLVGAGFVLTPTLTTIAALAAALAARPLRAGISALFLPLIALLLPILLVMATVQMSASQPWKPPQRLAPYGAAPWNKASAGPTPQKHSSSAICCRRAAAP